MDRQMRKLVTEGETDVSAAIDSIVRLNDDLSELTELIEGLLYINNNANFAHLHAALRSIEAAHAAFVTDFPKMLNIHHCKDLHNIVLVRVDQCRVLLHIAEQFKATEGPEERCVVLPECSPAPGEVCAICCDTADAAWVELPCGHVFHRGCATEWLGKYKAECPMCRQSIT